MTATGYMAYCITNLLNTKQYIGITTQTINIRWSEHLSRSKYSHSKSAIHSAIRKYGKENFKIEHIVSCVSIEYLKLTEIALIEQYNTFRNGYNLTAGGDFKEIHQDTKNKISNTKLGHKVSKETRDKISNKLKENAKNNPEYINKMKISKCKNWKIIYSDGSERLIKNMKEFCKNNFVSYNHVCKFKKCKKLNIVGVSY